MDQFEVLEASVLDLARRFEKMKREREELVRELEGKEEEIKRLRRVTELVCAKVKGLIERLEGIG